MSQVEIAVQGDRWHGTIEAVVDLLFVKLPAVLLLPGDIICIVSSGENTDTTVEAVRATMSLAPNRKAAMR
ncbi:MAG: hypothetical protein CME06_13725 [Gemmatimonadetes bacterium]|nr:hypothetical protein [Gemmatimonadota bacterium]